MTTPVDPGWAAGDVRFTGMRSANVAVYELRQQNSTVTLATAAPNQAVVVRPTHANFHRLNLRPGSPLPAGTRLVVEVPTGMRQFAVGANSVGITELDIKGDADHLTELGVAHTHLKRLKVPPVEKLMLTTNARPGPDPLALTVRSGPDRAMTVQSQYPAVPVGSVESKHQGPLTIAVPLAEASDVKTVGDLHLSHHQVGVGNTLEAANVTAAHPLGSVTIVCPDGTATIRQGIQGSAQARATVNAGTATIDGNAAHADIAASKVTVANTAAACSITATTFAHVRERADNGTTIVVTGPSGDTPAVVVGGTYAPPADHDPFGDATQEQATPALVGWGESQNGTAADCRIEVQGSGLVALADLTEQTEVLTEADLLVAGDGHVARPITATRMRVANLTASVYALSVESLLVTDDAAISGRLAIAGRLEVRGALTVPDDESAELAADVIHVHGPRTGALALTCTSDMSLAASHDAPGYDISGGVSIHDDGSLTVNHGTVEEPATLKVSGTCPALTVPEGREVVAHLPDEATLTTAQVEGVLRLMTSTPAEIHADLGRDLCDVRAKLGQATSASASVTPGGVVAASSADHPDRWVALTVLDVEEAPEMTEHTQGPLEVGAAGAHVSVHADAPHRVRLSASTEFPTPAGAHVDLIGPVTAELDGQFDVVTGLPMGQAKNPVEITPGLVLADRDDRISEARGRFSIVGAFRGRVHGPSARSAQHDLMREFRVVAMHLGGEKDSPAAGALIDVDLTALPFSDLQSIARIQVVDATPKSLRDYAKGGDDGNRAELRERAERMATFIEVTKARASSGTSRAAAHWAMNRLHHRALPRGLHAEGAEWAVRYIHRAFGYSYRPVPALVTWLGVTLALVALRVIRWAYIDADIDFWSAFWDAVLMPLAIVRLGDSIAMFDAAWANAVATITSTLSFVFLLIAVRNTLREPGDK